MLMTVEWRRAPRGLAKEHKQADREAKRHLNYYWWLHLLPTKFIPSAVQRYRYKPRTRGYQIRKAKIKGHNRPMEWSGTLRRRMEGKKPPVVHRGRATTMRFTGLPRYTYFRSGVNQRGIYYDRPNMPLDLITVDDADQRKLLEEYQKTYMARMRKAGYETR